MVHHSISLCLFNCFIRKDVPELTAEVARAAFPKGNPSLKLRAELKRKFGSSGIQGVDEEIFREAS